jgi:hypothetical protein
MMRVQQQQQQQKQRTDSVAVVHVWLWVVILIVHFFNERRFRMHCMILTRSTQSTIEEIWRQHFDLLCTMGTYKTLE